MTVGPRRSTLEVRDAEPETHELTLADGHQIHVQDGAVPVLEVRTPGGHVEVRIRLTAEGPVLAMEAARLELHATDTVDVRCREFTVAAREQATISSAGDVSLRSEGATKIDANEDVVVVGKTIQLN